MTGVWMMEVTRRVCPNCGYNDFDLDDSDGDIPNVGFQKATCRRCGRTVDGQDLDPSRDSDDTTVGYYDREPEVPEGD